MYMLLFKSAGIDVPESTIYMYSYEYGVPCEKSFPATAQQRGIVRVPVAAASSQSVALMMALLKGFLMRLSISQHLGDLGFAICCRLACLAASFGPE